MISGLKIKLFFIILFVSNIYAQNFNTESDCSNIKNFADYLYHNKEYYRAITEYNRLMFYFGVSDSIKIKIGDCYFYGGQYDKAIDYFKLLNSKNDRLQLKILRSYLNAQKTNEFKEYSKQLINQKDFSFKDYVYYTLSYENSKEFNFNIAKKYIEKIDIKSQLFDNSKQLIIELDSRSSINNKSPFISGFLSAIIPGAGYSYTENYKIGIASFTLNALFFYSAYEAFRNDLNITGITFSIIGFGWYFGNIWGSVNKAHQYNYKSKLSFFNSLPYKSEYLINDKSN